MISNRVANALLAVILFVVTPGAGLAKSPKALPQHSPPSGKDLYTALKSFQLGGGTAAVQNLTLKRDRAEMTFTGTFYFETPIGGEVYGAVFIGNGKFKAEVPPVEYEKDNVQRVLRADDVESGFRTAVLRFRDDTFKVLGGNVTPSAQATSDARNLAEDFEPRFLKQTALNVSARLAVGILNQEKPGFFLAQFDKGDRGRFTLVFDPQERVPAGTFAINAGEKGLIFAYNLNSLSNDVWMAFHSLEDYQKGKVEYSDANDLVSIENYKMDLDARNPKKTLVNHVTMTMKSLVPDLRAIPFSINEALGEDYSERLKKSLRLTAAFGPGGKALEAVQEDWDGGVTVFLPEPASAGESLIVSLGFEGDFLVKPQSEADCYYPRQTTDWYPRHGYLNRSTFDLVFHHKKYHRVVSVGSLVREEDDPNDHSAKVTEWREDTPIPIASFAVGDFKTETAVVKVGDAKVPTVLYHPKGTVKADFVVAEMGNSVRYFSALFGPYEFKNLDAVYFPYDFGQGLPTLLMLPKADLAVSRDFQFIAHEASHEWWGDMIAWRSYRDQWLSEGFADYSGLLYTRWREDPKSERELLRRFRRQLLVPAVGEAGIGNGPVANIGPIVLGHRLSTRASYNGYTTLIYKKGALVLRMLHFLFTDPETGNDKPFYDMMSDFVRSHKNGWVTTDDFIRVANSHFPSTPIAKKYQMKDLNWFFREWVYRAILPSYRLEYREEPQQDGKVIFHGTLYQEDAPENFIMPLPLVLHYGKNRGIRTTILAYKAKQEISFRLPGPPSDVELDPEMWILSKKTSEKHLK